MRKNSVLIGGGLGYCYKRWMSSSSSEGRKRSAAVWGNGDYGRLGYGNLDSMWRPKLMNSSSFHNSNLKSISCGGAHTLFLTETGRVYATGLNDFGQLGVSNNTTYCMEPLEVSGLKKEIVQISAGYHHSCAITENGSVYIFGEKAVDKLAFGDVNNATTPSMIGKLPYSREVACGGYHTCVITSGGELYTWGSNENGCLGNGSIDVLHIPERVEGPFLRSPVEKVSCGWKHTAAISEGNVFTWGWGGSHGTFSEDGLSSGGQLGHGDDFDYVNPTLVAFEKKMKALEVSCGFNHTGAILESVDA